MKRTITILFKFRFPFVRVPYPEFICWVPGTDEGELWKPWRMKQSNYVYNVQRFMKTQHPWVDPLMLTLLLSSPCSLPNCFSLLSCLVHRCALSPHRDAGGLCCVIRESWAGRCSSSTKSISSVNDKPHLLRCQKRTNRRPYHWGAENSAWPNMCSGHLCEFQWSFFLWCPTSSCDFLWLLGSAMSPLQLAVKSPFPRFKSGLQWTLLKVILIWKE